MGISAAVKLYRNRAVLHRSKLFNKKLYGIVRCPNCSPCVQVIDVFCVYSCTCHKIYIDPEETNRWHMGLFHSRGEACNVHSCE